MEKYGESLQEHPVISMSLALSLSVGKETLVFWQREYHFKDPRFSRTQKRFDRRSMKYLVSLPEKKKRNTIVAFPSTVQHRRFLRHLNFKKIEEKVPVTTPEGFKEQLEKRFKIKHSST